MSTILLKKKMRKQPPEREKLDLAYHSSGDNKSYIRIGRLRKERSTTETQPNRTIHLEEVL